MKIKFYELFEEEKKELSEIVLDGAEVLYTTGTIQEENDLKCPADIISVRTQSVIPESWAGVLKGIVTRSAGYDHLQEYLSKTGNKVSCGYLPNYCARSVAEQAVLLLIALLRRLPQQVEQFLEFDRNGLTGQEITGRKLVVLGVGYIGAQVVDLARALKMEVKGFDLKQDIADLSYVTLQEGLSWADVAICALPLNRDTKEMITEGLVRESGGLIGFVNVSRCEITPVDDLKKLLISGVLQGLALDVFENEPLLATRLRADDKMDPVVKGIMELRQMKNVILTPHNAFNTEQATKRKAQQSIEALEMFLNQGKFPHPVPQS